MKMAVNNEKIIMKMSITTTKKNTTSPIKNDILLPQPPNSPSFVWAANNGVNGATC